jgi:hypothetical protein
MNQAQLKRFIKINFTCDNCRREFERDIVYSPAPNLDELKNYSHYCVNCVEEKSTENDSTKTNTNDWNKIKKKSLGEVPQEASQNLQAPESAPSDKRISGRTKQLNLKVKEQTYWKLKEFALKEKCLMTEILEKSLECYGKHKK